MKKVILSVIGIVFLAMFYHVALPFAVMEAQDVVVDQMKNTDISTAAAHYVGNGVGLLDTFCVVFLLVFLAAIWGKTIVKLIKGDDKQ